MEVLVHGPKPRRVFMGTNKAFFSAGQSPPEPLYGMDRNDVEHICSKEFDKRLLHTWREIAARDDGTLQFNVDHIDTKRLIGEFNYVAQLNPLRAKMKRKSQGMSDVSRQPFDPDRFNFNKINLDKELIFQLRIDRDDAEDLVVVNQSPLEIGHSLLLPDVKANQAQVLTERSVQLAAKCVMLSGLANFKAGFNSMCGHASVNHLHWHLYYLRRPYTLPVETVAGTSLGCGCYELNYSAKGFGFEIRCFDDIKNVCRKVHAVSSVLCQRNVAHNVFITKGNSFSTSGEETTYTVTRVIIWPRKNVEGSKDTDGIDFFVATCELAGHFLLWDEKVYKSITAREIAMAHKKTCEQSYTEVKGAVLQQLKEVQAIEDLECAENQTNEPSVMLVDLVSEDDDDDDDGHVTCLNGTSSNYNKLRENHERLLSGLESLPDPTFSSINRERIPLPETSSSYFREIRKNRDTLLQYDKYLAEHMEMTSD